jgi:mRNA-degrading endonuclease YafQ of YafQ-DinJ toxin-antitoxin module
VRRALIPTPGFNRAARRFVKKDPAVAQAIRAALALLSEDAFDARLRTHKLKGKLAGAWTASAGYDLRIVFELVQRASDEAILLLTVGTHDEVY